MSTGQLSRTDVKNAITAAMSDISPGARSDWIRRSGVVERAYILGLLAGLNPFVKEEDLSQLGFNLIRRTMYTRSADDTFPATPIGKIWEEFVRYDNRFSAEALDGFSRALTKEIAGSRSIFSSACKRVEEILDILISGQNLGELDSDDRERGVQGLLSELEAPLRYITLLNTGHNISDLFEEN